MDSVGIERFVVSSTSICEGNYKKVLREINTLVATESRRVIPILWIIPQMLYDCGVEYFLESGIHWQCLKIHPQLNPEEWNPNNKNIKQVVQLAKQMDVPILIHTGTLPYCHAGLYRQLLLENNDIPFILAHGRPIEETIDILESCPNAFTDTAFMSTEDIVKLCNEKLSERVLWGTDYPIPKYFFRTKKMKNYYQHLLSSLENCVTHKQFLDITTNNAKKIW